MRGQDEKKTEEDWLYTQTFIQYKYSINFGGISSAYKLAAITPG
jgi:hypothetical protein